ncbi:MAG TPA: TonB-dependent receptor plug domain-containing protein, partial [Gammaproteobacteria bacterium]
MNLARPAAAALAVLALPLAAAAADAPLSVPPVVVSATRSAQSAVTTPASITVITRDQIEASGATQLAELLRGQGTVQLHDYYGDGSRTSVGLRGFGGDSSSSNTLVLVDGRRLNNTDIAPPDLASIALDDVERIEIVQGSAGALYGDQAVGGVINIVTRDTDTPLLEVRITGGSDATRALAAEVGGRLDNGLGLRLAG